MESGSLTITPFVADKQHHIRAADGFGVRKNTIP